jgi:hypothetical protein
LTHGAHRGRFLDAWGLLLFEFKRAVVCAIAPLAIAAPLAVTAPAADAYAGTPGCVTLTEYRSVPTGYGNLSQLQVARRFGTYAHPYWGRVTYTWDSEYTKEIDREWKICNSAGKPRAAYNGGVEVDFTKEADWDTGRFPAGPLRSTHKTRWAF